MLKNRFAYFILAKDLSKWSGQAACCLFDFNQKLSDEFWDEVQKKINTL